MSLKVKRGLWLIFVLLVVMSGPVTLLKGYNLSALSANKPLLVNFIQRMTGLVAFSLFFLQIALGGLLGRWLQVIGAKAYRYHITFGISAYLIMFLHGVSQGVLDYLRAGVSGLFFSFLPGRDIYLNLGKAALGLSTFTFIAAYFRTRVKLRRIWRRIHVINYLIFYMVSYHAFNLGTDVRAFPFNAVYVFGVLSVSVVILTKLRIVFLSNIAGGLKYFQKVRV